MTLWYVALFDGATDDSEGGARRIFYGIEDDKGLERHWPQVLGWLEAGARRYAVVRQHDEAKGMGAGSGIFGADGVSG